MDEDQTPNVNEEEVVDQPQDEAPAEQPQEVEQEQPEEIEEEVTPEEPQDEAPAQPQEEKPPSRRENLRIQQLLQKYGPPEERKAPQQNVDFRDMIDADDEVLDQLSQRTQQYGQSQYEQGLKEADKLKFDTRLEIDAPKVMSKYPQFDPSSDDFNPAVADSLNQMYLSAAGHDSKTGYVSNPNIRYADYIEAMMELADEVASRKVQESRKNITKQASRTGIRPDGSTPKRLDLSKSPQDMSDEELDAFIARQMGLPTKK